MPINDRVIYFYFCNISGKGYVGQTWVSKPRRWDTNGVNCLEQQRHPELGAPSCHAKLDQKNCGKKFDDGTLLMNEVPQIKKHH